MAKQGAAAYQRLTVPQTDMAETARAFGAISAANRRAQQALNQRNKELDEAKKAAKEKQKEERREKLAASLASLKNFDTKSKDLNEIIGRMIYRGSEEMLQANQVLENENASDEEKLRAQIKLNNLQNLSSNLKAASDKFTNMYTLSKSTDKDGNRLFYDNPELESMAQDYIDGNVDIAIDEWGNGVVAFKDKNGDGINDFVSFQELMDERAMPNLQKYQSYESILSNGIKNAAVNEDETDTGFRKTTIRTIDEAKLQEKAEGEFFTEDGGLTGAGRSVWEQRLGKDYSEFTPDQSQDLVDAFVSDVKLSKNLGKGEDFDWSNWRQNKQDDKEKEKEGISFVETFQYGNDEMAAVNRYSFNTPLEIKGTNKSNRPKTLTEIRYDKQNGNVVLMGMEYVGKETTKVNEGASTGDSGYSFLSGGSSTGYTTETKDDWKPVTITDKAEVTAILAPKLGVKTYDEIRNKLQGDVTVAEGDNIFRN